MNRTSTAITCANSWQHSRNTRPGNLSGPDAVSIFTDFRMRKISRDLIIMNSGITTVTGLRSCWGPETGAGRADFDRKVLARIFAFSFAHSIHLLFFFKGGIVDAFVRLFNNSLLNRHHFFECPGNATIRSHNRAL